MYNRSKLISIGVLLTVAALSFAPAVAAAPINASLAWSPNNFAAGGTTTATVDVAIDADCPSGGTYSGTITVTEPDGVSTATFTVPATACGTAVTAVYPTGFVGTAGTTQTGVYKTGFAGTTSVPGVSFDLTTAFFTVHLPPPPGVPQFGLPAMFVAAMGLVVLAVARKGRLFKF